MNFTEAMLLISENDGVAVMRPGENSFIWFDTTPFMHGMPPTGLRRETLEDPGLTGTSGFVPTIEDILAEDWEVYGPEPRFK